MDAEEIKLYRRLGELMEVEPVFWEGWYLYKQWKGESWIGSLDIPINCWKEIRIPLYQEVVNEMLTIPLPPLSWLVRELDKRTRYTFGNESISDMGFSHIVFWNVDGRTRDCEYADTPEGAVLRALIKVLEEAVPRCTKCGHPLCEHDRCGPHPGYPINGEMLCHGCFGPIYKSWSKSQKKRMISQMGGKISDVVEGKIGGDNESDR